MARLLVLGAGYLGAAIAARALDAGDEVTLADNWYTTERSQLDGLAARGARVVDLDIRDAGALDALLAEPHDVVHLLAAQASRPVSFEEPDYTEETNVLGVRRVAERVRAPLVFGSTLHVYGRPLEGSVDVDRPIADQGDLSHLSKVYGELCLRLFARRNGFPLAVLRLAVIYGPSPVEHDRPDFVTVVDKFRRLAERSEELPVDDPTATIGVVHVDDAARIFHACRPDGISTANVCSESITVGDIAALAQRREPAGGAAWTYASPFTYERSVAEYLA